MLHLSNELLLEIVEALESDADINAFAQSNRRLYNLANTYLYRHNVQECQSSGIRGAAQRGQITAVERLLNKGANVHARSDDHLKYDAMFLASKNGHQDVVELLLLRGAKVDDGPVFEPYEDSTTGRCHWRSTRKWGNALHTAARNRHEGIVKLLLAKGADPNSSNGT